MLTSTRTTTVMHSFTNTQILLSVSTFDICYMNVLLCIFKICWQNASRIVSLFYYVSWSPCRLCRFLPCNLDIGILQKWLLALLTDTFDARQILAS